MTEQAESLTAYVHEKQALVNDELARIVSTMVHNDVRVLSFLHSLEHAVLTPGKRIRPIFGLAVYELFKNTTSVALQPLCTVELIHAGSLILDDLSCMDNAKVRRGKEAHHVLFGDAITILASASLWIETFTILSRVDPAKVPEIMRVFGLNVGSRGLIAGQLLDLSAFHGTQTEEELEECYRLKTAVLFTLSASIAAILGDATREEKGHIEQCAMRFGIAYQIRDDIIDATHSASQSGKDAQKDVANEKPTYVSLLGKVGAHEALVRNVNEAKHHLAALHKNSTMLELLTDNLLNV